MKKVLAVCLLAVATGVATAGGASATIHPIVESFDCANERAAERQPIALADPPGQTPEYGSHSDQSSLRAILAVTKGNFVDPTSPALFGHKLDGQCGHAGDSR